MRIDFNSGPPAPEASQSNKTNAPAYNSEVTRGPETDQAQLSGARAQVQGLATQALEAPEVRLEKVQALRLAIQNGQYHLQPETVAGAIMVHMIGGTVA